MLNTEQVTMLDRAVKRIFSLPITKSTFRELQNAVLNITQGDTQTTHKVIETIITGQIDGKTVVDSPLSDIIQNFSIPVWVAKDVHDKGDFLNLITTDFLSQEDKVFFSNRIRRIDGTELHYMSDVESTLQTVFHFMNRLQEATKAPTTVQTLQKHKEVIKRLEEKLEAIKALVEKE